MGPRTIASLLVAASTLSSSCFPTVTLLLVPNFDGYDDNPVVSCLLALTLYVGGLGMPEVCSPCGHLMFRVQPRRLGRHHVDIHLQ
jgi:hypothetical protein